MTRRISENSSLLIRADAGGTLGTGHVMRMIALAQAWQDRGGEAIMAACSCPSPIVNRLSAEGIRFITLESNDPGGAADLRETISLAESIGARWIILDGYHFLNAYQRGLKENGLNILAVDDYGHCQTWEADLVLNQNFRDPLPASGKGHLEGPEFALLRREFYRRQPAALLPPTDKLRLLLTFGGVDPSNATLRILAALRRIIEPRLSLKILAGPANPNLELLAEEIAESPHDCQLIPACGDMPLLYESVDRVISAGGSSCYEWMLARKPGWIVSVAENQDAIVRAMLSGNHAAGIQDWGDLTLETISDNLRSWLAEPLPPIANIVIDGYGAPKVAAALSDSGCWIRPVNPDTDARFLHSLANEPSIRCAGRHPDPIPWRDHISWLTSHCSCFDSCLTVIETLGDGPVGQIRFHRHEGDTWEIGISIRPDRRKSGLGAVALALAMRYLKSMVMVRAWLAEIQPENNASQRLFVKLGFVFQGISGGLHQWVLSDGLKSEA
jgi:UDP-2,4-diacetamido-2,4,6-trideoxy-beta-L-altropyranose hydrolase